MTTDSVAPERVTCGYCRNCRWWESTDRWRRFGFCRRMWMPGSRIKPAAYYTPVDPTFGCVQWEAKDEH